MKKEFSIIELNSKKMSLGWHGFGGSVFQWHPELKIGFAFLGAIKQNMLATPTGLHLQPCIVNIESILS